MMSFTKPEVHFHSSAYNRLVQCLQSIVCPCRVPLHGPVQFEIIRGVRFVGHMFSSIIDLSNACNQSSAPVVCRCMDQSNSKLLGALGLSGTCFLPKLPLPLGISSPCQRRTEPRPSLGISSPCQRRTEPRP